MTLPTLRATGTPNAYSGTNSTLAKPAGTASGDLLIAYLVTEGYGSPASWVGQLPSGWSLLMEDNSAGTFANHAAVAYKFAGGSEPSAYDFNMRTTGGGVIEAWVGVHASTPFATVSPANGQYNASSSTNIPCPALTGLAADSVAIAFYIHRGNNGVPYTQPSGFTETVDYKPGTANLNFGVAYKDFAAGGSTGTITATSGTADESWSTTLALVPAVGGGDTTPPVLTSPTGSATGTTTATVGATTDEGNGTLYAVVTTSATAPTKAQIKAGQNAAGTAANWSGSVAVSSTGAKTLSATGLTASTTYYAHLMHEDTATNQSNVVSSTSFTTSAGASGSKGRYFYQFGSTQC